MKLFHVLLLAVIMTHTSCQTYWPHSATPTVSTKPLPQGKGVKTQIEAYHAMVYEDCVHLWAKNGLISPFEIYVYDLDEKANVSKAVYARFGPTNLDRSWKVGHLLRRTPGIRPVPDTLDPRARDEYIAMAAQARAKVRATGKSSAPTTLKIAPKAIEQGEPDPDYHDYEYEYEKYVRPGTGT